MYSYAFEICSQISSVFAKPSGSKPQAPDVMVKEITEVAGQDIPVRSGRRGSNDERVVHEASPPGTLGPLRLRHDHTTNFLFGPPYRLSWAGWLSHRERHMRDRQIKQSAHRIVFVTAQPEFVSAQEYASLVAYIPAQTMADDGKLSGRELLPMGSVFEGAMFVLFEIMVVYRLGESLGQSPEAIRSRHTNLE